MTLWVWFGVGVIIGFIIGLFADGIASAARVMFGGGK